MKNKEKEKKCLKCGQTFAHASGAKFCSTNCKFLTKKGGQDDNGKL